MARTPAGYVAALLSALSVASVANAAETVSDDSVVRKIDEQLAGSWRDSGVAPSRGAPDGAWARRTYLDLVGRVPTLDELTEFVGQSKPSRRAWLIDRLTGPDYRAERARWRATEWANLLIGRTGGRANNSLAVREPFEEYLREAFAKNQPADRLMQELVTATGSVPPWR